MMILDLHRQGLSVTAIARRTGRDPKTMRKYIERGLELPAYGPRQVGRPNKITPHLDYVRERVAAFPELTATRLTRELRERGYGGAYTAVKRFVAAIRPARLALDRSELLGHEGRAGPDIIRLLDQQCQMIIARYRDSGDMLAAARCDFCDRKRAAGQ